MTTFFMLGAQEKLTSLRKNSQKSSKLNSILKKLIFTILHISAEIANLAFLPRFWFRFSGTYPIFHVSNAALPHQVTKSTEIIRYHLAVKFCCNTLQSSIPQPFKLKSFFHYSKCVFYSRSFFCIFCVCFLLLS